MERASNGNPIPVYSAGANANNPTHTQRNKWLTVTAVTSCWGGTDNPCLIQMQKPHPEFRTHTHTHTSNCTLVLNRKIRPYTEKMKLICPEGVIRHIQFTIDHWKSLILTSCSNHLFSDQRGEATKFTSCFEYVCLSTGHQSSFVSLHSMRHIHTHSI